MKWKTVAWVIMIACTVAYWLSDAAESKLPWLYLTMLWASVICICGTIEENKS